MSKQLSGVLIGLPHDGADGEDGAEEKDGEGGDEEREAMAEFITAVRGSAPKPEDVDRALAAWETLCDYAASKD